MLTVYILASRREERSIEEFWTHMALMRRQIRSVTWANPLYVEDMVASNAVVPAMSERYVVIGCLSNRFVSALLDQPALRELVEGAIRSVPFIISPCQWNHPPCPFAGKMAVAPEAVTSTSQHDRVFVEAARRIREVIASLLQEL